MRKSVSTLALLAGLAFSQPALADSPATVYSDFAEDGVLSCGHSRSALKRALSDASLHQYGDPLTFIQMKVAVRRQLADGCRRRIASRQSGHTDAAPDESAPDESRSSTSGPTQSTSPKSKQRSLPSDQPNRQAVEQGSKGSAEDSKQSGGMVLLGVGLLLLTLGSGAWAARRAFGDRE
jgi:hypothetical protein